MKIGSIYVDSDNEPTFLKYWGYDGKYYLFTFAGGCESYTISTDGFIRFIELHPFKLHPFKLFKEVEPLNLTK